MGNAFQARHLPVRFGNKQFADQTVTVDILSCTVTLCVLSQTNLLLDGVAADIGQDHLLPIMTTQVDDGFWLHLLSFEVVLQFVSPAVDTAQLQCSGLKHDGRDLCKN